MLNDSFKAGSAARTSINFFLTCTCKATQQDGACVLTVGHVLQSSQLLQRIWLQLAVTETSQDVEVRKKAVWHVELQHRMRLRGRTANTNQTRKPTLSARHSRCVAAGEDGGLTSLPRAAHDVSSARRPLRQRAACAGASAVRNLLSRRGLQSV